jgi:hypothetical protein
VRGGECGGSVTGLVGKMKERWPTRFNDAVVVLSSMVAVRLLKEAEGRKGGKL